MIHCQPTKTMLKVDDVAWLLGTDGRTVQHWVDAGIIKAPPPNGSSSLRFKRQDIARVLSKLGA